jgi:molecular chaperone GrpE
VNNDHVKDEQQAAKQCKCEQQVGEHDCGCHCSEEPIEAEGNRSMQEQELENRLLRLQADFDNFRKRTARERLEQAAFVEAALVTHLLPVLDNFDRALANLPEAAEASWAEGVQLVHKQLLDVLEQQGLEHIDCRQPFDPNVHEAVMRETCDDDEADGTILQELQKGYSYKGKLLRPSMVKVATKG